MAGKRATLPKRYSDRALANADRRYGPVRYVTEGVAQILEDRGGEAMQSFLAKRTAARTMHLDQLLARDELALTEGREIDRDAYLAGCATWLRYASALGLVRRAKPTRTLQELMSARSDGT